MRFAHLSDWHATTLSGGGLARFRGKRLSGWASWVLSRRKRHDPAILEAAIADVRAQGVDRILVTGDLTHVSLEPEFVAAAGQLARIGPPERVFLVPGNHDCYVPVDPARGWDRWAAYLRGDPVSSLDAPLAAVAKPPPAADRAPTHADYPMLRVAGPLAAIGLCSAIPTPVFRAGGELGAVQLERLEHLLLALGEQGLCRVVMIHHPVAERGEPTRRALWDAAALRDVLARAGAELVVHGHKHRRRVAMLDGPRAAIPAVGVPSSSEVGSRPDKLAQYHVYTVARDGADRFGITACAVRTWDPASGRFVAARDPLDLTPA